MKLGEVDIRNMKLNQAANSLKLQKGLFLNKGKMEVCYHAQNMNPM